MTCNYTQMSSRYAANSLTNNHEQLLNRYQYNYSTLVHSSDTVPTITINQMIKEKKKLYPLSVVTCQKVMDKIPRNNGCLRESLIFPNNPIQIIAQSGLNFTRHIQQSSSSGPPTRDLKKMSNYEAITTMERSLSVSQNSLIIIRQIAMYTRI